MFETRHSKWRLQLQFLKQLVIIQLIIIILKIIEGITKKPKEKMRNPNLYIYNSNTMFRQMEQREKEGIEEKKKYIP